MFLFTGKEAASGRNGKSKTVALMKNFIGADNCVNISPQSITREQFSLAGLHKKLANLCTEISSSEMTDVSKLKALTGRDAQSAPRKYLSPIYFVNYSKQIFLANEVPMTHDMSLAFFNRWIIITFPYKFLSVNEFERFSEQERMEQGIKLQDTEIIDKISTPEELSGLLNWAINGLERLLKNKEFSFSQSTEEVKKIWQRKSNSVYGFVEDCIIKSSNAIISKSDFRTAYNRYCADNKLQPKTDKFINEYLTTEIGCTTEQHTIADKKGVRIWSGILLNDRGKNYLPIMTNTNTVNTLDGQQVNMDFGDRYS
jgi:putative DNA primase/helicase